MRIWFLTAALVLGVAACSSGTHRSRPTGVQVSVSACGQNWTDTAAGFLHITLHNVDSRPGDAQLINPVSGAVYAEVDPLGPGTTDTVNVSLSAGRYAWRCLMEDEPAVTGTTVTLTGSGQGATPGVVPVTEAQLIPATQAYEKYVARQLPKLTRLIEGLRAGLNDASKAKRAWLTAHLRYERLGAAYDAFGALDQQINGRPNGLPGRVHNPHWTGFLRIEYDLWHDAPVAELRSDVGVLAVAVRKLSHRFATTQLDPTQIAIRAHEITENALQFELTGETDFGSHSQLQTVLANLQGTQVVLGMVRPLLAPRYAGLSQTERLLHQSEHDIRADAGHVRIDADISELCERLAPVAAILEPRRTS